MSNCFKNCKSLMDLHTTIESQKLSLEELSSAEQERLVAIFCANTGDEIELPLTPRRYSYICEEVRTLTLAAQAADEIFNNMTMEDKNNMNKDIFTAAKNAADSAIETIKTATKTVKVEAGKDAEEFKDKADSAITTGKDVIVGITNLIKDLTGSEVLKDALLRVLYKNMERGTQRGFFDAASEARRIIYQHINAVLACDPDEQELKEVAALRYMLGEDADGKPTGRRSVFTAFANSVVWIARKVTRKFRAWFGTDAETNVFGTVGAALASVFGMACKVIGSVLKVAAHALVFAGSYVIAAAIKAVAWVWSQLKKLGTFIKSKFDKKDEAEDIQEDTEEEVILEKNEG